MLVKWLLREPGREILFASTCQGVNGYVDDSRLAVAILESLPPDCRKRCILRRDKMVLQELIDEYSKCQAYVGMRMHGAILSMLGGTPAFGVAYEQKTAEIMGQMGFSKCHVDWKHPTDEWISRIGSFLENCEAIAARLPEALDKQRQRASRASAVVSRMLASYERQG